MPDNSDQIEALDEAIASGALTVRVDGVSTTYRSLQEMRRIRQGLIDADTSGEYTALKRRKPRVARVNLGGF